MRVVKSVCELALFGGLAVLVGVGPVNAQQRSTINQGFEEFAPSFTPPKGYTITRDTNIDGWNSSDTEIEVWANGFSGVESPEGGYFVELNPNRPIRLSQQICLVENEILNFSYRHRARANKAGTPDQIVEFSAKTLAGDSQQVFSQSQIPTPTSNGGVPWITRSGTDVIFNGQTGIYDVGFESFNRGSIGNLLDDINIVPIGLTEFDLSSAQGLENATTGLPEFVISGVVAEDTVITFDIRGTGANPATLGDDFTIQNDGKFTILKGTYDGTTAASRFAVPMTILDDSITEVNETLEISIARVDDTSGATSRTLQVGDIQCQGTAQSSATYTILDAEPEIEVSTSNTNGGAIADTGTDMLGVQTVGVSGTVTYTITNTGNDILNLGTPTIDAAGANVTGTSVSLPANPNLKPGQSTTITVAFTPVSDGGFNFAITVPNNDPDEAPYNINLQGLAFSVPVANPDESLGNKIGSSPRITVLTDDQAATGRLLDKKSVQFVHPDTAQPVSSLEVSGQETWRVDGDSGVVTFTPFGDFTGNPDVVSYTVADDQGRRSEPATIKVTYTPAPVANADEKLGNKIGSTPEVTVLGNDSIAAGVGVDATSVVLLDPETDAPVKELFVDGQGTWTVTAAGTVTFAPLPALIGNPTDVRYTVADAQGNVSAPATIKVTYTPAPVANADEKLGNKIGSTAAVNLLQNDSAAEGHSLNAKSVMLIHPETSAPVKSIMIDGHGTWNVTDAGEVTFTPLDSFTGNPAPVKYTVEDMQGNITASASITVTYTEAPTTVADMIMDNETGVIVSINVLENDSAAAGHSLDAATLFLIDPSTGDHVRMLDVPGQGVWTVSSEGVITFEPDADFTGSPTPVTYQVNDTQGNASQPAMITIGYVDPTDIPLIEDILEEDLKQTAVLLSGNASRISLRVADRLDPNRGQQCGRNINDLLKENPVQFTSNSFFIDARNNDVLNEIARLLGTCPGVGFMIAGHTDSDASETYNITLSQNRVDAVRTALADRGVTVDRLQTRGFGESQPVATNATEEGQAMNRRVEFVLLEDAAAAQAACGDSGIVRRNVTGSGNDDGTSLTGDFASSGYDCVTDTYSETWGDLSVKHDDDLGTTGMLTLGTLRERQNDNKLFGRFIEGYLSRSDVDADGASGTITGVGVHAGLYGARATDSGLILSYYGSAAVGRHDFKIDAGAPTDGSYTYAGVFVGAAVGGERQLGEMMVRPSVGIDLGYARTIGSEISVADVDLEVDPVTFARGFVSLGMTHEMDAGSLDFTPRLFCAVGGDSDDNACGFGGSLNYVTLADTEGARWDVSFDYERIADSQTASLRLARTWDIFATGTHVGHL